MKKIREWTKKEWTSIICLILGIMFAIGILKTAPRFQKAKAEETQTYEYAIFSPTVWEVWNTATNKKERKGIQGTITITFNNFNAQLWYKEKQNEVTNFKYVGNQKANITDENQDENNETLFHFKVKDKLSNAYVHIFIQQKDNTITNNGILQTKTNTLQDSPTTYEFLSNLCACYLSDGTKIVLLVSAYENVFTSRPDGGNFTERKNNLSYPYLFNHVTLQSTEIRGAYEQGLKDGKTDRNAYGQQQYNKGYAEGTNAANKYSFENLIFAVIDAPIQSLYGLLNFDLLGVNILNLFLALY